MMEQKYSAFDAVELFFILDDNNQVVRTNMEGYKAWSKKVGEEGRLLCQEHLGDIFLSTVFLMIDHGHGTPGGPVVFETMAFTDFPSNELACERYRTYEDALRGHEMVRKEFIDNRLKYLVTSGIYIPSQESYKLHSLVTRGVYIPSEENL